MSNDKDESQDVDPFLGKIIADRYEIIENVGKGSFGSVYASYDRYLGNSIIALKILHPIVLQRPNAMKRLAQEIQASNRINHENIVRFYDFFRDGDLNAISMEFVRGPSLRKYIEETEESDLVFVTDVLRHIALGLQTIHQHGIIHRDLKPDNILLADGWNVKITDFGIAYLIEGNDDTPITMRYENLSSDTTDVDSKKLKKQLAGTVRYISPESVKQGVYDQRSDIYALGVILYEMITGQYVYEYENSKDLLKIKVKQEAPSPALLRKDCPRMLEQICCKALSRDPELRYQSADELLTDANILREELTGKWQYNTKSSRNMSSLFYALKILFIATIIALILSVIIIVVLRHYNIINFS